MTTSFAPLTVAIGDLVPHPGNVRSNSPETYDPENIAHLKASIGVLGLLQTLLGPEARTEIRWSRLLAKPSRA